LFLVVLLVAPGCSPGKERESDRRIVTAPRPGDIVEIRISPGDVRWTDARSIETFARAIRTAVFDPGQLDIRPSDATFAVKLKQGGERVYSLWLADGFYAVDHQASRGHLKLTEEAVRALRALLPERFPEQNTDAPPSDGTGR